MGTQLKVFGDRFLFCWKQERQWLPYCSKMLKWKRGCSILAALKLFEIVSIGLNCVLFLNLFLLALILLNSLPSTFEVFSCVSNTSLPLKTGMMNVEAKFFISFLPKIIFFFSWLLYHWGVGFILHITEMSITLAVTSLLCTISKPGNFLNLPWST